MKKLPAIICAALLALSGPAVAFANTNIELAVAQWDGAEQLPSAPRDKDFTWNGGLATFDTGKITDVKITFKADTRAEATGKDWIIGKSLDDAASIPSSVQAKINLYSYKVLYKTAFEFKLRDTEKNPTTGDKTLGPISPNGGDMSFDYTIADSVIAEYMAKVASPADLQYSLYAVATGSNAVETLVTDKPATQPTTHVVVPTQTTVFVTVLTDASKQPPVNPTPVSPTPTTPAPTVTFTADDDSSSESSTWRSLQVTGSNEVSAQGYLFGSNATDGDDAYLSIRRLTSGSAFDTLRAAAGGNGLNKAFDVTLYVNGKEVHSDFGRVRLSFAVGSQYDGRKATVWHLHNNGELTSEDTWVIDGAVSVEASDLSEFGIDIEGVSAAADQIDDGTTSPKTGQNTSAATAPAALLVAAALGAVALAARRRVS